MTSVPFQRCRQPSTLVNFRILIRFLVNVQGQYPTVLYSGCCIAAAAAAAVYGCSIAVYGCSVAVYGCYLAVQGCSIAENAITIKPESSTAAGDARDVCSVYGVFRC